MQTDFQRSQTELNQVKSLHLASWSFSDCWRDQAELQICVSSSALHWRINKNWVSDRHWVVKCLNIWLLPGTLFWCLFKSWPEHPHLWLQTAGNHEQSAFLNIFDLLPDIFWGQKAFRLTAQERGPPTPTASFHMGIGPKQHKQPLRLTYRTQWRKTPMTPSTFRSRWWNYQLLMPETDFYHVGFKIYVNRQRSIFHIAPQNSLCHKSIPHTHLAPGWPMARYNFLLIFLLTLPPAFGPLVASCQILLRHLSGKGRLFLLLACAAPKVRSPESFCELFDILIQVGKENKQIKMNWENSFMICPKPFF